MNSTQLSERYNLYIKRYKAYVLSHTVKACVHMFFCFLVFAVSLCYIVNTALKYGFSQSKLLLAFIISSTALALDIFYILFFVKGYCNEILQLKSEKFTAETGIITQKSRYKYTIEFTYSRNSKRKKQYKVLKYFVITKKNCESNFSIGEQITVIYANTYMLMLNDFDRYNSKSIRPVYAIYAFSGDETANIHNISIKSK